MTDAEREALFADARDVLLAALPGALAIYVYGSFARGEEWPGSDLDLAVLLPYGHEAWDKLALMGQVALRVKREVDLIDLHEASDVLRREVLESGRTLFVADADRVLEWEASAMSRYARYREEIRDLLEDFHRTGVGYGG